MTNFDFMSMPKVLLILGVIILYLTVTVAIIKSLLFKKKACTAYHVAFVCTDGYKGIDKRRRERLPVDLKARIINETRSFQHSAQIKNISAQGIGCVMNEAPFDFNPGDKITIVLLEPEAIQGVEMKGRIAWKKSEGDSLIFGAEFSEMNPRLTNYITHLKKQINQGTA